MFGAACAGGAWQGRSPHSGVVVAVAVAMPAAGAPGDLSEQATSYLWEAIPGALPETKGGAEAVVEPDSFRAFELDVDGLEAALADAPHGCDAQRGAEGALAHGRTTSRPSTGCCPGWG